MQTQGRPRRYAGRRSGRRGRLLTSQARVAVVWHSRTGAVEAMARAAAQGGGANARLIAAGDTHPDDLLEASGYIFVCPENLATMSGVMKDMFDRCYYPLLGRVEGRPYATIIAAGSDGSGAQAQIDRIVTGWRLKRIAEPMIVNFNAQTPEAILAQKHVSEEVMNRCGELCAALCEGISLGIF